MAPQPPPEQLNLAEFVWAAGRPIHRIHPLEYEPNSFNPTDAPGRFRPIYRGRTVVPTLYGGTDFDCALAETVFHDVPLTGTRAIGESELGGRGRSVLIPKRDLRLAELNGHGLRRLELRNSDLIDFDDEGYQISQQWGQAIYNWSAEGGNGLDGLIWTSRQFNKEEALMLFGSIRAETRVRETDLEVDEPKSNIPLEEPETARLVRTAANRAGITIVVPGFGEA